MLYTVFCPGYLEWWLDSNLHLVLFIQYIHVHSIILSQYPTCIIWEMVNSSQRWLIHAEWWLFLTSVGRTLYIHVYIHVVHVRYNLSFTDVTCILLASTTKSTRICVSKNLKCSIITCWCERSIIGNNRSWVHTHMQACRHTHNLQKTCIPHLQCGNDFTSSSILRVVSGFFFLSRDNCIVDAVKECKWDVWIWKPGKELLC